LRKLKTFRTSGGEAAKEARQLRKLKTFRTSGGEAAKECKK